MRMHAAKAVARLGICTASSRQCYMLVFIILHVVVVVVVVVVVFVVVCHLTFAGFLPYKA